ncbi:MAG: hypothetical protein ACLS4Z_11645 [Christensenellaceae bacterium]
MGAALETADGEIYTGCNMKARPLRRPAAPNGRRFARRSARANRIFRDCRRRRRTDAAELPFARPAVCRQFMREFAERSFGYFWEGRRSFGFAVKNIC